MALSAAMWTSLPLIELSKDIKSLINMHYSMPSIFCPVYEDNKSCIAVAEYQNTPLWTKNIATKYRHFRSHVNKTIKLVYVDTKNQLVDFWPNLLMANISLGFARCFAVDKVLRGSVATCMCKFSVYFRHRPFRFGMFRKHRKTINYCMENTCE